MPNYDRSKDTLKSLITEHDYKTQLILSSSDVGVRLNKGRAGSKFAPEALKNTFLKMGNAQFKDHSFKITEVSNHGKELTNFNSAQDLETQKIIDCLDLSKKNIHIGGGHDHALPMLRALDNKLQNKPFCIINLDAHLDTRIDSIAHSGTPFRDFDDVTKEKHTLIQYGIHLYANSSSTQSNLNTIDQKVFKKGDPLFYKAIKSISKDTFIYLSLDADAIDSTQMQAVSAVNFDGISIDEIKKIINIVKKFESSIFGIYEYNPIFDDLSQKGARNLSSLIYDYIL